MNKQVIGFVKFLAVVLGIKTKLALAEEGAGGDPNAGGAGDDDEPDVSGADGGGKKSVPYKTYSKTVDEVKGLKRQLKELHDKLAGAENDKLTAEGKKDELIAKLRNDFDKLNKTHKDTLTGFVMSSLENQVREVAASMGGAKLDKIVKLIDIGELTDAIDTKTFKADREQIKSALESLKKDVPELFNKPAPKINGKLPNGKAEGDEKGGGKNPYKDMKTEDLWAELRKIGKQ